MSQVDIFEDD